MTYLNGPNWLMRGWLQPHAAWRARRILAGILGPARCRDEIAKYHQYLAKRSGITEPFDTDGLLQEEIDALNARIDALVGAIAAEIRPLVAKREPKNILLATAHDCNAREDFLIREDEIEGIVKNIVRLAITAKRPAHV
jgi:hypothetical protein